MKTFYRTPALRKSGTAFVTVLCLTGILMIAAAAVMHMTGNSAFLSRKINSGARALAVAEAGITDHVTKMQTNSGSGYSYWAAGALNTGTLDNGTYIVHAKKIPSSVNVLVTSTGIVLGEVRVTVLELLGETTIDGALIAGGNITLNTSAMTVNGDIMANGNIYNSQGNPTVNGNVSAAGGTIQLATNATYTSDPSGPSFSVADAVASITPSIVPPFSEWKILATNGGIYKSSSYTWSGIDIAPANGVVFVDGNATVQNRSSLRGTLVATGNITIDNQFKGVTITNGWPAFLAGVNISLDNRNTITGLVFAGNDVDISNNRDIRGKVYAGNNISIKNRGVITPPPSGAPAYPQVILGGWLR